MRCCARPPFPWDRSPSFEASRSTDWPRGGHLPLIGLDNTGLVLRPLDSKNMSCSSITVMVQDRRIRLHKPIEPRLPSNPVVHLIGAVVIYFGQTRDNGSHQKKSIGEVTFVDELWVDERADGVLGNIIWLSLGDLLLGRVLFPRRASFSLLTDMPTLALGGRYRMNKPVNHYTLIILGTWSDKKENHAGRYISNKGPGWRNKISRPS